MKKKILLFSTSIALLSIAISSYKEGPAAFNGYDCTGAETGAANTFRGCGNGTALCHGTSADTSIHFTIEIDSTAGGAAVTQYVPGHVYTVKLTGVNNTTHSLPKFGFQVAAITGSTGSATPTNAGALQSTGLPTGVQYTAAATPLVADIVEHSMGLAATTGTGSTGTTYVQTFTWTAPAAGTGAVTVWGALNAVSGTYTVTGTGTNPDSTWNVSKVTLSEDRVGVPIVTENIAVSVYPNPVMNNLNIQIGNTIDAEYAYEVYDLNGRSVICGKIAKNSANVTVISATNWAPGMYFVKVFGNGAQKTTTLVKQ